MTLTDCFQRNNTDKFANGYGPIYEEFFDLVKLDRFAVTNMLEIGIGTLLPDTPSSMAGIAPENYRPGASLRAWRDYFPNATIWGLDIQPDTQFEDDRIVTRLANTKYLAEIDAALGDQTFDLIVDDGNHNGGVQLLTYLNLRARLRTPSIYLIEDVLPSENHVYFQTLSYFMADIVEPPTRIMNNLNGRCNVVAAYKVANDDG